MTEFAYSGVGINPHHGPPGNPFDRAPHSGGSSSGADGLGQGRPRAVVAIGTDTGGSVQHSGGAVRPRGVSSRRRRGCRLAGRCRFRARSIRSGRWRGTVACCAIADAVLAGEPDVPPRCRSAFGSRSPDGDARRVEDKVGAIFARATSALSRRARASARHYRSRSSAIRAINATGGFSAAEAFLWHRALMERRGADYDPRVRGADRARADHVTPPTTWPCWPDRQRFIARIDSATARSTRSSARPCRSWRRPSPPSPDDRFRAPQPAVLRNPSIINFLDRCAITLPIERPGEAPVGLMLIGRHGEDRGSRHGPRHRGGARGGAA